MDRQEAIMEMIARYKAGSAPLRPPAQLPAPLAPRAPVILDNSPRLARNLPVLGSPSSDAITLGRYFDPDHGIANKMQYGGPLHVLAFGPNGKGKTTGLLMVNALQMSGCSIVFVDPKGELAAVTAPYRATLGPVVIINPFGVFESRPDYGYLKSAGFNPLARLDPRASSFNADAGAFADACVPVGGKDPHWDESARALLAALVMYEVIEARSARRIPTFANVRKLLCEPSGEGNGKDIEAYGLPDTAAKMMCCGNVGLANKAAQFTSWTREIEGIVHSAQRHTEKFDDPEIVADMSKDGFDFRDLKRQPTTVYLVLPPDMIQRHSKWLRIVLTAAIQGVMRPRERGEPKVVFMMDEFFALGRLEIVESVWALVRGYGIQMMPILQSLVQLKHLYPDMWESFIGMAGATVSFGPNDMTTAEYMSRRAGETTRTLMSYNHGGGTSNSQSGASYSDNSGMSYSAVKVPLISPHQMLGMRDNFMQVTLSGVSNVIPAYAPPYFHIDQCAARARENPYHPG